MITYILIGFACLLAGFLLLAATRPATFLYQRKLAIAASPGVIFAQVDDLRRFQTWSPWAKVDPNCRVTYEGPEAGEGAVMRWDGNNKVGAGSMTNVESRPGERVRFRLEFLRPFKGVNQAEFTFMPEGGKTTVTWSMSGRNNFFSKVFGLLINCEKMCGGQFEKGLADLQAIAEGTHEPASQKVAAEVPAALVHSA